MQNTAFLGLNKPDYEDFADVADLNENADLIEAAFLTKYNITLPAAGWSASAPYTQTVQVTGLRADSTPIPLLNTSQSSDYADEKALKKNFGFISYYDTADDQITFTAMHKKPTVNLSIRLKGV